MAVKNCWFEDTVLSPVLRRERYRTLCHRWLPMADGDVVVLAHCEAPLLVNIAHIQKVNDLRALLRPTISSAPRQRVWRLDTEGTTGPR